MVKEEEYNILIVEDEYINAKFIEQTLISQKHKVAGIVANALDAKDIIKNQSIDLIFMDINLEGSIDGLQLAKDIYETYNIPIIYTTAYGDSATIEEAKDTNIYGYLIKPFDERDIEAVLNVAIKLIEKSKVNKNQILSDEIDLAEGCVYSLKNRCLCIDGAALSLTQKESQVLHFFCKNINCIIDYDTLKENIWMDKSVANSTIRDIILRIRKKVPHLKIENIARYGYILKKKL